MEISKQELEQINKEEISIVIEEGWLDRLRARTSGAGAAVKGVAQRTGAAAKYATTGKVPPASASAGATYAQGKKSKILQLHKNKYEKVWADFADKFLVLNKELHQDAKKLGLLESPLFQEMRQNLKELRLRNDKAVDSITSYFDRLVKSLESGERTE